MLNLRRGHLIYQVMLINHTKTDAGLVGLIFLVLIIPHLSRESLGPLRKQLKNITEYKEYAKSGNRPADIPSDPQLQYKDRGWIGWPDFLGTQVKKGRDKTGHFTTKIWLPFEQARAEVRSKGLKSFIQFKNYLRSEKPVGIPSDPPHRVYENKGWIDYFDFIGFQRGRIWRPFLEARDYLRKQNIQKKKDYAKWDKRPEDIPAHPDREYRNEWRGRGDWLGTGAIASFNREYRSFEQARNFVHSLGLKNQNEWWKYCKSDKKPKKPVDIPSNPAEVYKKEWKSWGDWFGTDFIATHNRKYLDFEPGREKACSLGLKSIEEYTKYVRSAKPPGLPTYPDSFYRDKGWISWGDWLGTGTIAYTITGWSIEKVKEILKDMIKNKVIDEMSDDERYHILASKGVLNIQSHNRFSQLFKNLAMGLGEEELKALEDFANSVDENLPELSNEEELQIASSEDLVKEREDPLENENIPSPQRILELAQTPYLESICQDVELMQFFVNSFTNKLWKRAFRDREEERGTTVKEIRQAGQTGKKFHDTVREKFLSEYEVMENTAIPKGYASRYKPTLTQRYVASKIKTDSCFGNFSGTGAGKTLSAILASRVIDSKMTLVVCPNDVVGQWASKDTVSIAAIFPDSEVLIEKSAFKAKYDEDKHQYLVLNYDKFSQEDSPNLILNLVKERIDFVVLDEIHFIKKRDDADESKRHRILGRLMDEARKKNSNIKVLGMSATPVINNLREGISLLEIMTGKEYNDLADRATGPNAMALHQKLSTMSIREMPEFSSEVVLRPGEVYAEMPPNITSEELKRNPLLIEQILTDARIPEIIKRIEGQTIIYTEYVTKIVEKLKKAVAEAGYKFAEYTGDSKELSSFINKTAQVLIASRPISVGVDGLQDVCHNLIINTLPWTNAQFKQLIGRLHRFGQRNNVVNVHIIKASVARTAYDEKKWVRIENKRTLADAAVDGRFPKHILQSKEQMQMELIKWLERLERNEISIFNRRNLNVILTQTQRLEHIRQLSEFSILNKKINTQRSETTHEIIQRDPEFLVDYHRKLDENKKDWPVHPVNVIAQKINDQQIPTHLIMKQVIGDFGCGRGELMGLLKENKMYSFDHHNILNEKIIPCDMKSVPIKDEKLDIAVFSLSLMATNWRDYIKEAKRCLVKYGLLFIAETTKQLSGRLSELRNVIQE
jgi:hypothetical protein